MREDGTLARSQRTAGQIPAHVARAARPAPAPSGRRAGLKRRSFREPLEEVGTR